MTDVIAQDIKGVRPPKTKLGLTKMQALLEAAERLFVNSGFYDVSVSDICKEAHTAVGTFYIYFESKTDLYRCLVAQYQKNIKKHLTDSISGCTTRRDAEQEGIKCFVRFCVEEPSVYKIIWGSLAVEKEIFENYYISFAKSYANALSAYPDEVRTEDPMTLAYMLMGITNFVGLRAIFEQMDSAQIDSMIHTAVMPILENGMFR